MKKRLILSSLVAALAITFMASTALAGPKVAIVKASDDQWDLVLNSFHNTLPDIYYQEPPAGNAGIRPTSEWSKESEIAIEKMVREAVKLAGGWPVEPGDKVLIKINSVGNTYTMIAHGFGDDASLQGAYTDARVARAAALMALESGAEEVLIGEGPGVGSGMANMRELGMDRMVEELNNPKVKLVDLGEPPWKWYPAPKALALDKYAMHEVIGEADKIINIPCLKTHILCGITSALKNTGVGFPTDEIYGTIKMGLPHAKITEVITDVNMIAPSSYVIVDGIWGLEENGPLIGPGVPMGLIIAGTDPVACDAVSTVVMGFKVENIGTTVMAEKHGLGTYKDIEVVGTPIAQVQTAFTPPLRSARWPAEMGDIVSWDSQLGRTLPE